ncbi:MAG: hypothetical protein K6C36_04985, partial [Clostridia bacterium]|nr:hypothetical protein [Clostridia bacterium]
WIDVGGKDPCDYLRKLRGRVKVVHFKDYDYDENGNRHFTSLGKGRVDLNACFRVCQDLRIPYIVYEQDGDWTDGDPFKATEESWAYMQELAEKNK